jgi:uncharacterized protein YndB with AHSA1/START domain
MTSAYPVKIDPRFDLVLERVVAVPPALVWKAWTQPEHLMPWFTPAPWRTVECEIDLRPGGIFRTVMRSPEGQDFPNLGCYLDIVENQRLVWTNVLLPGYRPTDFGTIDDADCAAIAFTAFILLEAQGSGTRYTAIAVHGQEAACKRHEEMGFHDGWGKALDQLVASVATG